VFKIKPDVDVDPPPGFDTQSMFLLRTILFRRPRSMVRRNRARGCPLNEAADRNSSADFG
jgi:hypothetical protein